MIVVTGHITEVCPFKEEFAGQQPRARYAIRGYMANDGEYVFDVYGKNIEKFDIKRGEFLTVYLKNEAKLSTSTGVYQRNTCTDVHRFPPIK